MRYPSFPILVAILLALALPARADNPSTSPRQQQLLSDTAWQYLGSSNELPNINSADFDKAAWTTVQVPHVFETHSTPSDVEQAWYRRKVSVPPDYAGKRLYLRVEGAAAVANVYVNGQHMGEHKGAYTAFIFDATDALRIGDDNELAVRVDNRKQSTTDCLPNGSRLYKVWGGLYRKVWLIATDPLHIDPTDDASPGVYITPTQVSDQGAELSVRTLVLNKTTQSQDATVQATLLDPSQQSVQVLRGHRVVAAGERATLELNGHIDHPKLWAPLRPNLYHLRVDILRGNTITDSTTQPVGFRWLNWKDGTVTLNGKPILFAGADLHQEIESKASAMSEEDFRQDYALVTDLGANWMRLPHYPHAQFEYDLCDQLGIAVWAENGHSNKEAPTPNAAHITTEMVKQNYNHPSIVVWSVGNEASQDTADANVPVVKSLDQTRPVFVANMKCTACDFHGANTYPGWYGKGDGFSIHNAGFISESGAGGVVTVHCDYADARHVVDKYEPEEYQQQVAEQLFQHIFRDGAGNVGIYTWWCMRDFSDNKYKHTAKTRGINTKGLLTYAGDKKDVYYLYRCFLRPDEPTVHIASKRYFLRTGAATNGIKAYSNARHLALTLNGRHISTLNIGDHTDTSDRHLDNVFYWPVPLQTGRNDVSVDDGAGHTDSAVIYFYGKGGAPAPTDPNESLVDDLKSSNPANVPYYIDMPVQPQWPIYYDLNGTADNSFDSLPPEIEGARWIAMRRPTKAGQETDLTFTVTRPATVFIMSTKTAQQPHFASDAAFQPVTSGPLVWRDNDLFLVPAELYSRHVNAGETVHVPRMDRDMIVMLKP